MRQGDVLCWVYSTASDTRKEEFFPPTNSPLYTGKTNEAYIEALDDERFGICFGIPATVATQHGADSVDIELNVDKGATALAMAVKVRNGDAICDKIDDFTCLKEGNWQKCGFSFRKINLDEDLILSHDEAKDEIQKFGGIKVDIYRGYSSEGTDVNAGIISSSNRRLDEHVSSKRVIKDNGITHSVNTPVLKSLNGRHGLPRTFTPLPRPHDHVATFVFRYRSQMSLELKRIIGDDREEVKETSQTIQQDIKQEMKQIEPGLLGRPQAMKRGSVDQDIFATAEDANASSPVKRRKSMAYSP